MKTWRDFNVDSFREVLREVPSIEKISTDDFESQLEKIMESAIKELKIKIGCLTCGVKYSLQSLDHVCQSEDTWLLNYIKQSDGNKTLPKAYIPYLQDKYPLPEAGYVFRGLNFLTKREYEGFMKELETGTITYDTITSWTTKKHYAENFARIVMNGTRGDSFIRKQELQRMFKERANITGYKGVLLVVPITKEQVLCDISEAEIGNLSESEVILLPGTYPVHVLKQIDRVTGETEWSEEEKALAEKY